jgi:hypothetical protein
MITQGSVHWHMQGLKLTRNKQNVLTHWIAYCISLLHVSYTVAERQRQHQQPMTVLLIVHDLYCYVMIDGCSYLAALALTSHSM